MRVTRSALLLLTVLSLATLSLTSCGSSEKPAETPAAKPAEEPAPSSDFAMPVTAPMHARKRLLHDLKQRNDAARQRANQMDQVLDQNR